MRKLHTNIPPRHATLSPLSHNSFRTIHNHGSIHINVECLETFLLTIKVTPKWQYIYHRFFSEWFDILKCAKMLQGKHSREIVLHVHTPTSNTYFSFPYWRWNHSLCSLSASPSGRPQSGPGLCPVSGCACPPREQPLHFRIHLTDPHRLQYKGGTTTDHLISLHGQLHFVIPKLLAFAVRLLDLPQNSKLLFRREGPGVGCVIFCQGVDLTL